MRALKAILPAAGLGTRFLPATCAVPKALLPILDKPAIQYVVEEAIDAGVTEIVLVIGPGDGAIARYFEARDDVERVLAARRQLDLLASLHQIRARARISHVIQEQPRGLGDAVLCARGAVGDGPFAVLLPDVLFSGPTSTLQRMLAAFEGRPEPVVAVLPVERHLIPSVGVVDPVGPRGDTPEHLPIPIRGVVEKPSAERAPSNLAIVGRYVLPAAVFEALEGLSPGSGGEVQLTDAIDHVLRRGGGAAVLTQQTYLGAGEPLDLLKAAITLALARPDLGPDLARWLAGRIRAETPARGHDAP